MAASKNIMCHRLTLSSKKVVLLREPKIKDQELAGQLAGAQSGENILSTSMAFQREMIKILLLEVDGKKLANAEKESLDDLFSLREYSEINVALKQLMGDATAGKPQMELVPVGQP